MLKNLFFCKRDTRNIKKPVIGIVGRPILDEDGDRVISIMEDYRRAVIKNNAHAILILPPQDIEYANYRPRDVERLNESEKEYLKDIVDMCDGILIPGGNRWYKYDEYIYEYAYSKNMPILGICAGMQLMACIDNNKCNDTKVLNETIINHHQKDEKYVHYIDVKDNTKLKEIIKQDKIRVNSRHKYHISKLNNFKISAISEDGLIEAIENKNKKFVVGVQWHPESMIDYDSYANKIYKAFIESCKKETL